MNADNIPRRVANDSLGADCPEDDAPKKNDAEWRAFRYVLGEMTPPEADAFEEVLATDQAMCERVATCTGLVANLLESGAHLLESGAMETITDVRRNGADVSTRAEVSTGAVRVAKPSDPAKRLDSEKRRRRARGWAITALAAAVCCAAAIGLSLMPLAGRTSLEDFYPGDSADDGAGHLVAIWSQRLADFAPDAATTESAGEAAASERPEAPLPGESDDSRMAAGNTPSAHEPTGNTVGDSAAAVADQFAADDSDVPGWMVAAVELGGPRNADGTATEIWEN